MVILRTRAFSTMQRRLTIESAHSSPIVPHTQSTGDSICLKFTKVATKCALGLEDRLRERGSCRFHPCCLRRTVMRGVGIRLPPAAKHARTALAIDRRRCRAGRWLTVPLRRGLFFNGCLIILVQLSSDFVERSP